MIYSAIHCMCKTVYQSAFVISLQERRGPLLHCLAKVLQLFEVSETVGGLYLNPGVVRPVSITPTPSPKPKTELMSQGLLDQLVISTTDGISPCHAASVVLQALLFLLTHSFSMLCYLPMWQSRTMSRAFICCRDSMRQTVYLYCYH